MLKENVKAGQVVVDDVIKDRHLREMLYFIGYHYKVNQETN